MKVTTIALALALSIGCATDYEALSERDAAAPPGNDSGDIDWPDPTDPGCTLGAAAFCETFDAPSPGGRGGDLDETVWSVSRYTNGINPTQGMQVLFHPSTGLICGERRTGMLAPDDYVICSDASGSHLTMTMDDGGGTVVSSFRPRQPFDFTGRTGVIAFDLGGRVAGGHGHWPEIMITSEPSPAPYQDLPGLAPFPRHGIGIELGGQVNCTDNPVGPYAFNRISTIKVLRDYQVTSYGPAEYGETECFEVSDERMNHYELRITQDSVELWVTDPGAPASTLRRHVVMTGLDLPFSRGYVHFQQAHYNSCKDDAALCAYAHTFNWDNIGFDGPVLPRDRGYDVEDALVPWDHGDSVGQINLGYVLDPAGRSFDIAGVDPAGATAASINFNAWDFGTGSVLGYQLNGGAWLSFESPVSWDETQGGQGSFHVPIDVGLLRPGTNTLALRGDGIVVVNVDVTVR